MSETRYSSPGEDYPVTVPASEGFGLSSGSPLLRLGGALGIAASVLGMVIFFVACAGFGKVLVMSIVPLGLSVPGLVISLVGAVKDKPLITEDTHVLQALFVNIAGIIGGLLEFAVWMNCAMFYK